MHCVHGACMAVAEHAALARVAHQQPAPVVIAEPLHHDSTTGQLFGLMQDAPRIVALPT